jgi:delta-aminolevulinic acid dehydratase/porphobilinogen synthase
MDTKQGTDAIAATADAVDPSHYRQGNIEVIDFILDQKFNYLEGNIIKYVSRHKFKNGKEDLHKAQWYLTELINAYS